jgi:precorrin-2 dehydrogenase / sirohydrochlorin ferrochelatase
MKGVVMVYYPINLNLNGRKVVVIGGGRIAERKITGLIEAMAVVTVISPKLTIELTEYAEEGKITWKKRDFTAEDIQDAFLVIAATNQPETNLSVKKAAAPHQLVSLVDNPEVSDFILPAVVNQGKLSITVSTSGASPILAKKIKQEIADQFGPEYKEYVDFLYSCRKRILEKVDDPKIKKLLLSEITEPTYLHSKTRHEDFKKIMNQRLYHGLHDQ